MFFEAQKRFENGQLFSHQSYIADLLKNYGDNGRKIDLPKVAQRDFERGLEFRRKEKQHYANITAQFKDTQARFDLAQAEINELRKHNAYLAQANAILNKRVFPSPADGQNDTRGEHTEPIISSTPSNNEPPSHSRDRSSGNRDHEPQQQASEARSEAGTHGSDAGRPLPDASDGPEPDVGGPAAEHDSAERREGQQS